MLVVQILAKARPVPLQVGDVIADLLDRLHLLGQVVRLKEVLHLSVIVSAGKLVQIEEGL